MTGKTFELNESTLRVIENLGKHMPGGFFSYIAEELLHERGVRQGSRVFMLLVSVPFLSDDRVFGRQRCIQAPVPV